MDKNFTPEQIDMINRIVFAHLDQMKQKTAEIVEETERAAHQQLQDSGIDITDFSPANPEPDRSRSWRRYGRCPTVNNDGSQKAERQRKR